MRKEKFEVIAGFPDFWQEVHESYPLFFKAVFELEPIQNQVFRKPVSEPLHKVLRHVSMIVSNSLGALVALGLNGYGNDAMRVARSMFEGSVISGYLKLHPERLSDYLDWHWIRQKHMYDYIQRYQPGSLHEADPQKIGDMKRGFEAVKHRYMNKKGKLRKSWSRKPLRQMAEEVGMGQLYLTYYSFASSIHHLDFGGLSAQAGGEPLNADVAPSKQWLEQALIMGHSATWRCLSNYNEVASLGMDKDLEAVGQSFIRAWKK